MLSKIYTLLTGSKALTATEYALIGAAIVLVVIGAFQLLGGNIAQVINAVAGSI